MLSQHNTRHTYETVRDGRSVLGAGMDQNASISSINTSQNNTGAPGPQNGSPNSTYYPSQVPSINLPKGGGSLRSIDEKFQINPTTGTASLTIPIPTTAARNNMTPSLSLTYDSGSGNSTFGLGWSLCLSSISRRTSKGIPKYEAGELAEEEEDVFAFSGVEDLVPKLAPGRVGSNSLHLDRLSIDGNFLIRQYTPRTEGSFLRIERWSHRDDLTSVHWRTISKSNVTSIYGISINSRISDPYNTRKIFCWLIALSYDGKGNAIIYNYKPDDEIGINANLISEAHRPVTTRGTHRYIKSILYGNKVPNIDQYGVVKLPDIEQQDGKFVTQKKDWMFEVVFDYGDHTSDVPLSEPNGKWNARKDPFSSYKSGFELRTTRLCARVLMFHHLKEEIGVDECLVSSTELLYEESSTVSYLAKVTQAGFSLERGQNHSDSVPISYLRKELPPIQFDYTQLKMSKDKSNIEIKEISKESIVDLPVGINNSYDWVDINGEGRPSVVYANQNGWYVKKNLSNFLAHYNSSTPSSSSPSTPYLTSPSSSRSASITDLSLNASELVSSVPNLPFQVGFSFLDLDGNGSKDLILSGYDESDTAPGFWRRTQEGGWTEFITFQQFPSGLDLQDPNIRLLDLTGNGKIDIIISDLEDSLLWYPGLGSDGYAESRRVYTKSFGNKTSLNEPKLNNTVNGSNKGEFGFGSDIFSIDGEGLYLADSTGDGLTDLVRVRNGDISYWPNIGYGRFGARVTMENSPWMDTVNNFSYSRLRLGDIDGSGCFDILYFPPGGGLKIWINEAGNGFSDQPFEIPFPQIDDLSSLKLLDLFGNGACSLVWSTSSPGLSEVTKIKYVEFNRGLKPHLLKRFKKGSIETRLEYKSSSQFYQEDQLNGIQWATKLSFPVQCLSSVSNFDYVSGNYKLSQYKYHHGFYDAIENEFRGFGMVETFETEYHFAAETTYGSFSFPSRKKSLLNVFSTPVVLSKRWYHTGAYFQSDKLSEAFQKAYYSDEDLAQFGEPIFLRSPILHDNLTSEERRQAWRSLRGTCLREEIYQMDGSPIQDIPFRINEYSYYTRILQSSSAKSPLNRPGVFYVAPREHLSIQLERKTTDHKIDHNIFLESDDFGNVTKSVEIKYGRDKNRLTTFSSAEDMGLQTNTLVIYTEQVFTNAVDTDTVYLAPLLACSREFQVHGLIPLEQNNILSESEFGERKSPVDFEFKYLPRKDYTDNSLSPGLRLIGAKQLRYKSDDLSKTLPPGTVEAMGICAQIYTLALTPDILRSCYQSSQTDPLLQDFSILAHQGPTGGGYVDLEKDNYFWIPSGTESFTNNRNVTPIEELATARASFFTPVLFIDPFQQVQTVAYDNKFLLPTKITDALGNTTSAVYDYARIQPALLTDANGNQYTIAYDELGSCTYQATKGSAGTHETGDYIDALILSRYAKKADEVLSDPVSKMHEVLGPATACQFWGFPSKSKDSSWSPGFQISIKRDTHVNNVEPGEASNLQLCISYFDGSGKIIQTKQYAEANTEGAEWIGQYTILTSKGAVLTKFVPAYDRSHLMSRPSGEIPGRTAFYDAMGREVAILNPNMTWSKNIYGPWNKFSWDEGDTIGLDPLDDFDVKPYFSLLDTSRQPPPSWMIKMASSIDPFIQAAVTQSTVYSKTPTEILFDVLGNEYCTILDNGDNQKFTTKRFFDIQNNQKRVLDSKERTVSIFDYDMVGNLIHSSNMESGQKWLLKDTRGQQIFAWDSRGTRERESYDALRRLNKSYVKSGTESEYLSQQIIYGEESLAEPEKKNLRGMVYQTIDQALKITNLEYDYAGNCTRSQRQFLKTYKGNVDLAGVAPIDMEDEIFESKADFDALNRPILTKRSDGRVSKNGFNRQGLLKAVYGSTSATPDVEFITDIIYDANNQQISGSYGNGSKSQMAYDPLTLQMSVKRTIRADGSIIQNLDYVRDCMGNITHIEDTAQQSLFFRGTIQKPTQDFTYDAIGRLISSTGREHVGQTGQNNRSVPSSSISGFSRVDSPTDAKAMTSYAETYLYDSENNILSMAHVLGDASIPGWTRVYTYEEPSLLEPSKPNNRLTRTTVGKVVSTYSYEGGPGANGLMSSMAGFEAIKWDPHNQLSATSTQRMNNSNPKTPETTYYRYDRFGNRVRKVTERMADADSVPTKLKEHFYIEPGCDMFTKFNGDGTTPKRTIQTAHFFALDSPIASIEVSVSPNASPDTTNPSLPLARYFLSDHNSSISLTLDEKSSTISQEEYSPYGSTVLRSSQGNVHKKYRYSGKELDRETGLYYFGQRYLMPWLGRWLSPDPIGILDGCNVWCFCGDNPLGSRDRDGLMMARNGEPEPVQPSPQQQHAQAPEQQPAEALAAAAPAEALAAAAPAQAPNLHGDHPAQPPPGIQSFLARILTWSSWLLEATEEGVRPGTDTPVPPGLPENPFLDLVDPYNVNTLGGDNNVNTPDGGNDNVNPPDADGELSNIQELRVRYHNFTTIYMRARFELGIRKAQKELARVHNLRQMGYYVSTARYEDLQARLSRFVQVVRSIPHFNEEKASLQQMLSVYL